MSPVATIEPHDVRGRLPLSAGEEPVRHLSSQSPRHRTLEAALASGWAALRAGSEATCLLCGGNVRPRWSAGAGVVGGRCRECGTEVD